MPENDNDTMIITVIFCVLLAVEIFFVYLQIKKLRGILDRTKYTGRTEGEILKSRCEGKLNHNRFRYTVGYSDEGIRYTFKFLRDDQKPLPNGTKIAVIFPTDAPKHGCAENDTVCFSHAYGLLMAHSLLIAATGWIATPFYSELMKNTLGHCMTAICMVIWNLALVFMAAVTVYFRIFWHRKSLKIDGTVMRSDLGSRGALVQTVRYRVNGIDYTFTEIHTGWSKKVYAAGERIPVRYLIYAPFAAECADHIELFRWGCVLFELFPPLTLLYVWITEHTT